MSRSFLRALTAPPDPDRLGVSERLLERFGDRYLRLLLFCAAASIPFLTVPAAFMSVPYFDLALGRFLGVMPVVILWMALVGVAAEVTVARILAPLSTWLRSGRRAGDAPNAWQAAVLELPRAVLLGGAIVVVGAVPATTYFCNAGGAGAVATISAIAGITVFVLTGAALHYLLWERALRPVVVELNDQLPSDFRLEQSALSISNRLLMLIPIMTVATAFFAGALSSTDIRPELRPAVGLSVALAMTLVVALPLTFMLRRSLLGPMELLLRAMRQVEHGDLDARLPVIAADEIGTIAQHFNSMLEGLQERESLRAHNVELVDDLRASRARIVATADEERRRMERDLHDGAQQHLVLLKMKLGMLGDAIDRDPDAAKDQTEELKEDLGRALAELRDLAHGIYPAILEHEGLPGALRDAADRSPLPATFGSNGAGRYRPEVEAAVYFCCLEALQNAAKHAGEDATATVSLSQENGRLRFEVSDNGAGFDADGTAGSAGLQNMADRIGALGGELRVESRPGAGTRVIGDLPLTS
jgi:signal transduction histidine kinase